MAAAAAAADEPRSAGFGAANSHADHGGGDGGGSGRASVRAELAAADACVRGAHVRALPELERRAAWLGRVGIAITPRDLAVLAGAAGLHDCALPAPAHVLEAGVQVVPAVVFERLYALPQVWSARFGDF